MNNHRYLLGLLTMTLVLFGCKTSPVPQSPPPSDLGTGNCTLEQLEWNTVVEGFDQERSLKILTDLQGAVKANPNGAINEAGFGAKFTSAFNDIVKATNQKTFNVSQDVQDIMVALRRLGCDMQAGLFQGNLTSAQNKYLELIDRVESTKSDIKVNINHNLDSYISNGNRSFNKENWVEAKFYYDLLIELDQKSSIIYERRGYCNYKLGRNEAALSDFSNSIELSQSQDAPQLFFFRGNVYLKMKNYKAALADFQSLLEQQPSHRSGLNQIGLAYIGLGEKEEGCLNFNKSYGMGNQTAKTNIDKYCN